MIQITMCNIKEITQGDESTDDYFLTDFASCSPLFWFYSLQISLSSTQFRAGKPK